MNYATNSTPMSRYPERNALLFFVRDERDEAQRKPLPAVAAGGGRQGYRYLNRILLSRLKELEKQGITLIVVSASQSTPSDSTIFLKQRGGDFGERITNGVADAFQRGYHNVVVVGNDCPDVSPGDIQQAFDLLASGASYVGAPTKDGGAFLVGLRHNSSCSLFRDLPWQTSQLFSQLCLLPQAAAIEVIREDFDSWLGSNALRALTKLFHRSLCCRQPSSPSQPYQIGGTRRKALTRLFLSSPPLS